MATLLATRHPLELTKSLFEFQSPSWEMPENCLDLCKKVGKIALAILLFIPAVLADLILLPFSLLARTCCHQPTVDFRIQRLETGVPASTDDVALFRAALIEALSFQTPERKAAFQDLIRNDGVAEEGEPIVEIYKWSAEIYMVHHLRGPDPERFPMNHRRHQDAFRQITDLYQALPSQERAAVCYKCIDPEFPVNLNAGQVNLLRAIQACALDITRNPDYNVAIYTPVANEVDNL